MSKHCCIPDCNGKYPDNLYAVPAKRFCKIEERRKWAEELEKIVLSLRADTSIRYLYKRDGVKICGRHFNAGDFIEGKCDYLA